MQFGFDTDSFEHGKAALILYAIYRSRESTSSLNGLDTWSRFVSYIRGARLKSVTTAEFVDHLCKMAKTGSIKPVFLGTGGPVKIGGGMLMELPGAKEYGLSILKDDSLLELYDREAQYLVMLVRERIQREKLNGIEDKITEEETE